MAGAAWASAPKLALVRSQADTQRRQCSCWGRGWRRAPSWSSLRTGAAEQCAYGGGCLGGLAGAASCTAVAASAVASGAAQPAGLMWLRRLPRLGWSPDPMLSAIEFQRGTAACIGQQCRATPAPWCAPPVWAAQQAFSCSRGSLGVPAWAPGAPPPSPLDAAGPPVPSPLSPPPKSPLPDCALLLAACSRSRHHQVRRRQQGAPQAAVPHGSCAP